MLGKLRKSLGAAIPEEETQEGAISANLPERNTMIVRRNKKRMGRAF